MAKAYDASSMVNRCHLPRPAIEALHARRCASGKCLRLLDLKNYLATKAAFFAIQGWNGTLKHFAKARTFTVLKKQLVNTRVRSEKDVEDALISTVQAFASGRLKQPKKA